MKFNKRISKILSGIILVPMSISCFSYVYAVEKKEEKISSEMAMALKILEHATEQVVIDRMPKDPQCQNQQRIDKSHPGFQNSFLYIFSTNDITPFKIAIVDFLRNKYFPNHQDQRRLIIKAIEILNSPDSLTLLRNFISNLYNKL